MSPREELLRLRPRTYIAGSLLVLSVLLLVLALLTRVVVPAGCNDFGDGMVQCHPEMTAMGPTSIALTILAGGFTLSALVVGWPSFSRAWNAIAEAVQRT